MELANRILDILKEEHYKGTGVRGVPVDEIVGALDDESISTDEVLVVLKDLLNTRRAWVYDALMRNDKVDDGWFSRLGMTARYMWLTHAPDTYTQTPNQ